MGSIQKGHWRWFSYLPEDGKAAQAELDRLAEKGWMLTDMAGPLARFQKVDGKAPPCWAELASPLKEYEREEFFALCREAGWEVVRDTGPLWYFRARPGQSPDPIQSDHVLEWEEIWRKQLWRRGWDLLGVAVIWLLYLGFSLRLKDHKLWEIFFNSWSIALSGAFLLLLLCKAGRGVALLFYRRRCRKSIDQTGALPVPGRKGAWLRGLAPAGNLLLWGMAVFCMVFGSGGVKTQDGYHTLRYQEASFLARHQEYWNFDQGRTYLDWYDCTGASWLADWVERSLVEGEGEKDIKHLHLHEPIVLSLTQVERLDRAWMGQREGASYLVARWGDQVACIEAQGDLTDLNERKEIWERSFGRNVE